MELIPKVIQDNESLSAFRGLLQSSKLDVNGLDFSKHLLMGFYDDDEHEPVATGGLELYGNYAVLRSLSVKIGIRGQSLGSSIADHLIAEAKKRSIKAIYLLTEHAKSFFMRKGFRDIKREDVPAEVKASSEFSSDAHASAACLYLDLTK